MSATICGRNAINAEVADIREYITSMVILRSNTSSYSSFNASPSLGLPVIRTHSWDQDWPE